MHMKTSKRSIPLTEKVEPPQHSSKMTVHRTDEGDSRVRYPSPTTSLKNPQINPNSKIAENIVNPWPLVEDESSSWDRQSGATSVSWPEELEEVATKKVLEHWRAIERTLYDEGDPVTSQIILEECTQWRTQLPHLRIVGKSLGKNFHEKIEDVVLTNAKQRENCVEEEVIVEHSAPKDEPDYSPKRQHRDKTRKEAYRLILGFMCAELSLDGKGEYSLSKNLDAMLRITPAPTYSGRNPLRNQKTAHECVNVKDKHHTKLHKNEKGDHCNNFDNTKNKSKRGIENSQNLPEVTKNVIIQEEFANMSFGGAILPISARRQKDFKDMTQDGVLINRDRLYTPQLGRNKLGTVFNEKIIVSPVPFVTTTRESFSTLKTIPVRLMGQPFDTPMVQRSSRNINSGFKATSARRAGLMHIPQSAWQVPVCPTVWPKNSKLAPIDSSRLPSSQNRSLAATPIPPRRSRNSLSPIPRDVMPISPLTVQDSNSAYLGVQGKQIVRQSSRLSLLRAGWESSPRKSRKIRKKVQNGGER